MLTDTFVDKLATEASVIFTIEVSALSAIFDVGL